MTRSVGEPAPEISARNQDGEAVPLTFDDPTVLYFYPRDDTSGCTTEARQFDAEIESYRDAGVSVYGVSTDDVDSHADFAAKHDLGFDLLADPDGQIAEAFGLELRRNAAPRTTFVLGNGEVLAVYEGVSPDGHARQVLSDLIEDDVVDLEL